ncbi:unnamed protein product [Chironomus riparius]|uniref:Peptidase S1 domain-containing protein n=1 Tax=Chironomus riparius TaxID=315576 RepID=A0A9N9S6J9_9DIPT|nr:unnamed protein product [Chironomus riparius]
MDFKCILVYSLFFINAQLTFCFKCKYRESSYTGYECELIPDAIIIGHQQLTDIQDDDIHKVRFHGNSNKITNFTESQFPFCKRFKNAKVFDVYEIEFIDKNLLKDCKNLIEAWIYYTEVVEISSDFFTENSKLITLVLSRNKITTLPENIFINQHEVDELLLDENELNFLPSKIFKSLTKLRTLYLGKNQIEVLNQAWFETLTNLEHLSLNDNEITDLPENVFLSLEKLQKLWLDGNQLTTIHADSFWDHRHLTSILLKNNKIQALDEDLIDFTAVSTLDMTGNICYKKTITKREQIKRKLQMCFENYQPRDKLNAKGSSLWNVLEGSRACGKSKIVFGTAFYATQTDHGGHPWNAAIIRNNGKFLCGGTLLSHKLVITAAHCLEGKRGLYHFDARDISVILGAHNISQSHEKGKITVGLKATHIHHEWNPNVDSYDADIAILELENEIPFTQFIQPICIVKPGSEIANKTFGYVTGFGKSERADIEDIARLVKTPIHSYQDCGAENKILQSLISNRAFCGGFANGTGVCTGDSGSGLIVVHENRHYLRGIVSASLYGGINGCNLNEYSIFTDVLGFYGWIRTGKDDKILIQELLDENRRLKANGTQIHKNA